MKKLKGKHVFRKFEIIHVWRIVSSVAQKRNPVDSSNTSCKKTMLSNACCQKFNIARLREFVKLKDLNSTVAKRGSAFIGLMTSDGAIWFKYQRAVLLR